MRENIDRRELLGFQAAEDAKKYTWSERAKKSIM
jgi:hypothetical protein